MSNCKLLSTSTSLEPTITTVSDSLANVLLPLVKLEIAQHLRLLGWELKIKTIVFYTMVRALFMMFGEHVASSSSPFSDLKIKWSNCLGIEFLFGRSLPFGPWRKGIQGNPRERRNPGEFLWKGKELRRIPFRSPGDMALILEGREQGRERNEGMSNLKVPINPKCLLEC